MKNSVKNIVVTVCFIMIISGLMLANIVTPDVSVSYSERRKLREAPAYSIEKLFSGELFQEFEKYCLDQFVFRDSFRGLKSFVRFNLLKQKDNNKIYIAEGTINKMEYPLNEKSIISGAEKLNGVYRKYLRGMNVSYAIIPDKNYFTAAQNGYLSMDYDRLLEIMNENVKDMKYIDLFGFLTIEDYYKTDIHWSQDRIIDIADILLTGMGNSSLASEVQYNKVELYPFYGSYYGQAALKFRPDIIKYLTNETIENSIAYDHIDRTYSNVYMPDMFGTIDSYDVFLSGAKSIITVTNPMCSTGRELLLFRDSFGSSIAPLLIQGYSKITLIDLRYLSTDLLGNYIDLNTDSDVLFLYNTIILNNSAMLK